jgi:hypothetical protein
MVNLSDDLKETHTWNYLLMVNPRVQVEVDDFDDWTPQLLQKGLCWSKRDELTLDVTFMEREDRCELQQFLDAHGLCYSVEPYVRDQDDEAS